MFDLSNHQSLFKDEQSLKEFAAILSGIEGIRPVFAGGKYLGCLVSTELMSHISSSLQAVLGLELCRCGHPKKNHGNLYPENDCHIFGCRCNGFESGL